MTITQAPEQLMSHRFAVNIHYPLNVLCENHNAHSTVNYVHQYSVVIYVVAMWYILVFVTRRKFGFRRWLLD